MLNKVLLIGRLTKDPEVKALANGQVANFSVAVNRSYKDKNDEWKEEVSYFDIEVYGKLAEKVGTQLKKGNQVLIEGELRQDRWESAEGDKRSRVKIVAERTSLVSKPGDKQGEGKDSSEDVPF